MLELRATIGNFEGLLIMNYMALYYRRQSHFQRCTYAKENPSQYLVSFQSHIHSFFTIFQSIGLSPSKLFSLCVALYQAYLLQCVA